MSETLPVPDPATPLTDAAREGVGRIADWLKRQRDAGAVLRGVSLADVTAMLSPDAIGFDKAAEPPTGQMVSLLQAGLKRG